MASSPGVPPSPKRGLSEYEEGRQLGQGAYGAAIQAVRISDRRVFVLKKIVMRNVKSDKEEREVKREVMVMKMLAEKCDHPNIVAFYDAFMEKETLHIVMECADGGSLDDLIKTHRGNKQPISMGQIVRLFTQLSMAVEAMHGANSELAT